MTLIARYSRKVLETTMTPGPLLERAVARGRLPAARFRVEGALGGSSRLLNLSSAESTRARYGGTVIELITANMFLTAQAAHLDLPFCARCGAVSRHPCRTKLGDMAPAPHACRLPGGKMTIAEQAAGKGFCGTCSAPAGVPCKTPKARPRRAHSRRPDLPASVSA